MGVRCTMLFNRSDIQGWSESYWTNFGTIADAITGFVPVSNARRTCLSQECYLYGIRYTSTTAARTSRLIVSNNPQNTATLSILPNAAEPDAGVLGVLGQFTSTEGRSEERIIRGIPDSMVNWSAPLRRMIPSPMLVQTLNTFSATLTANANQCGWFRRSFLLEGGAQSTPITGVTINPDGFLQCTVGSSAGFNPVTSGALITSGFKGLMAAANGTYSALAWSVPNATTLQFTRALSQRAIDSYSGQGGFVRRQQPLFVGYAATAQFPGSLIRSHKIGRPFGATRGRRSKVA